MSKKLTLRVFTLVRVAVMLSVIFVSWGLDDLPGFFSHPARAAIIAWAVLMTAVIAVMGLDVQPFREGRQPMGRQRWLMGVVALTGITMIIFMPYADRRGLLILGESDAVRYAGLIMIPIGDLSSIAALRTLGKQYSGYVTLQDDHRLIQHGIYSVIRHPIYLRGLLVMTGLPLLFRSWLVILGFTAAVIFVTVRIRQEERLLAEEFGEEFEAYRKRTKRLIPFVW